MHRHHCVCDLEGGGRGVRVCLLSLKLKVLMPACLLALQPCVQVLPPLRL